MHCSYFISFVLYSSKIAKHQLLFHNNVNINPVLAYIILRNWFNYIFNLIYLLAQKPGNAPLRIDAFTH